VDSAGVGVEEEGDMSALVADLLMYEEDVAQYQEEKRLVCYVHAHEVAIQAYIAHLHH